MKTPWKKLSSKVVHQNHWYKIRQDKVIRPDGNKGEYNVLLCVPAVFIVAINEKKEIYLVNIYRYTAGQYSFELPAGSTDGKDPLSAARRELKEEAGLKARKWKKLGKFHSMLGFANHMNYVFLATDLEKVGTSEQREEGIKNCKAYSFKRIQNMVRSGKFIDGDSVTALSSAAMELKLHY
jgi:8-oxo-dGTP pyrophosphatase MutT (NUDIX family)